MTTFFGWCHEKKRIISGVCKYASCCLVRLSLSRRKCFFLLPSGVEVEIVELPFHRDSFTVSGCDDHSAACLINGHMPFGTDLELPKTFVMGIRVSYQGHAYSLDSSNMYNAWGVRDRFEKVGIRYFGGTCVDTKIVNSVDYSLMGQAHS